MLPISPDAPLHVALVTTADPVRRLVTNMLRPFAPRVQLTSFDDLPPRTAPGAAADVALFDLYGDHPLQRVRALVDDPRVAHVALFAASTSPFLVDAALAIGVSAVVMKGLEPGDLVAALEQVRDGERVGLDRTHPDDTGSLTDREQQVLLLLSTGMSNQEIGRELYLGVETIRTHVRQILRKLRVSNRTQAAMRATEIMMEDGTEWPGEHSIGSDSAG